MGYNAQHIERAKQELNNLKNEIYFNNRLAYYTIHPIFSLKNSKLGNIPSIGVLSGAPFSCSACAGQCGGECYAIKIEALRPQSLKNHAFIYQLIKNKNYDFIVKSVNNYLYFMRPRFFRFNESGEIMSAEHLKAYIEICKANPDTNFTIYTKNLNVIKECISDLKQVNNLILVLSRWLGFESLMFKQIKQILIDNNIYFKVFDVVTDKTKVTCENALNGKTCAECLKCYKKDNERIIYEILR